jgi:hypothetical protein
MDALYVTLAVSRKTVVRGRYVFALALNACAVAFSLLVAAVGLAVRALAGFGAGSDSGLGAASSAGSGGAFWAFAALAAIFAVIQLVQLPILFKLGYAKGKFVSLARFCIIMAAVAAFGALGGNGSLLGGSPGFLAAAAGNAGITALISAAALALMVWASCSASLALYKKREF